MSDRLCVILFSNTGSTADKSVLPLCVALKTGAPAHEFHKWLDWHYINRVATQVVRNIGKVRLGYIKRVATQVERNTGKARLGYIKRVTIQVERNMGKVRLG